MVGVKKNKKSQEVIIKKGMMKVDLNLSFNVTYYEL